MLVLYSIANRLSQTAFLRVLIAYRADRPLDIIEVYEHGLHDLAIASKRVRQAMTR